MSNSFIQHLLSLGKFAARYGRSDVTNSARTNRFVDGILSRRSVRSYQRRPLEPELLARLIACAQSAPTSSMIQPWSVITVESDLGKERFFSNGPHKVMNSDPENYEAIMSSSVVLIWLADFSAIEQILSEPHRDWDPQIYQDCRRAMNLLNVELRTIIDCTIAAQTLSLAAESLGLGTVYLGGIRTIDCHSLLNIPSDRKILPLFGMALGYPEDQLNSWGLRGLRAWDRAPVKPRLPQEWVWHREQYQHKDPELLRDYNQIMAKFYESMNMPNDWFWRVLTRTRDYPAVRKFRDLWQKSNFRGL